MLTYPKSTKRVRRIPMHLSSGHVTLMPGKFSPLFTTLNFPQSDIGRRTDSRWALPQISSYVLVIQQLYTTSKIKLQILLLITLLNVLSLLISQNYYTKLKLCHCL